MKAEQELYVDWMNAIRACDINWAHRAIHQDQETYDYYYKFFDKISALVIKCYKSAKADKIDILHRPCTGYVEPESYKTLAKLLNILLPRDLWDEWILAINTGNIGQIHNFLTSDQEAEEFYLENKDTICTHLQTCYRHAVRFEDCYSRKIWGHTVEARALKSIQTLLDNHKPCVIHTAANRLLCW
jgi:hypothetical protein